MTKEIDTSWCDFPTCPYCGNEEDDACDIDHSDGAETEMSCGSCGKDYVVSSQVMQRWTSRTIEGDWP